MRKLVDVSSYNGVVSWEKAKTYGCQGAILKIIRKDLNRDKKFNENYAACNENEIAWGVYNYSYATTATKAKSDMELVCDILDKIDKTHFEYGVWFDIEDKVQASLNKTKIAEIINAAQQVVAVSYTHLLAGDAGQTIYNGPEKIELVTNLDGREIARTSVPYIDAYLGNMAARKARGGV